MRSLIILLFVLPVCKVQAQGSKPPLQLGQNLSSISDECISPDGRYVLYKTNGASDIVTLYDGSKQASTTLPFDARNLAFDAASSLALFTIPGDSVCFIQLATGELTTIDSVQQLQLKDFAGESWVALGYTGKDQATALRNMSTGKTYWFNDVSRLQFFRNNPWVLLVISKPGIPSQLLMLNLLNGTRQILWSGETCFSLAVSRNEQAVAFACQDGKADLRRIRSFDLRTGKSIILATEGDSLLALKNVRIHKEGFFRFANSDSCILFFAVPDSVKTRPTVDGMNIYRFYEDKDYSVAGNSDNYAFAVNRYSGKMVMVLGKNEMLDNSTVNNSLEKLIIKRKQAVSVFGQHWQEGRYPSLMLASLSTGITDTISERISTGPVELSPDNRFLVYYDRAQQAYFCYDTERRISKNISSRIPFTMVKGEEVPSPYTSFGIAAWNNSRGTVLIYDQFDIWELDYRGNNEPRNITRSYGRQHQQVLRLLRFEEDDRFAIPVLNDRQSFFLTSVNETSLKQGFYQMKGLAPQLPVKLTEGDIALSKFIKARGGNHYLFRKESASQTPNLFVSADLKDAKQVSFLNAQEAVNWMSTELITHNGRHGVLYKPENFDPNKKYPLIFSVYGKYSERIHEYLLPRIQGCILDIPFYVSNGYCVFVPDLQLAIASPGKSASDQLEQWLDLLCSRNYIDSARIGIQGHSWGGYEVNFTITQTKRFAAAVAASGPSDFVSSAHSGNFSIELMEVGQCRIGKPFAVAPELYTSNSPIYHANSVSTPLLLMTGTNDFNVPAFQSKEMFYALKRRSKDVWLLEYIGDAHVLNDENGKDFDFRTLQFFNHFLKGEARPDWM